MKNRFILLLVFSLMLTMYSFSQNNIQTNVPDYEIKVKFKNLKDTVCYLGFHFGNNKYVRDTARINNKGIAVFKGSKPIEGGVYLIITPRRDFFEFILTEKNISLETDTSDFVKNMKVVTSEENKIFYNYLNFMREKHAERTKLVDDGKKQNTKDSIVNLKIAKIDTLVKKYRENVKTTYPNSFFTKILKGMDEPQAREKFKMRTIPLTVVFYTTGTRYISLITLIFRSKNAAHPYL